MRTLMITLLLLIGVGVAYLVGYNRGKADNATSFYNYYDKVENLLDSIYESGVMSEDAFNDIVMESDTYYFYEEARAKIESAL